MKNVLNALDAMLEAYRKKEREFPSYDELAGLLKAPAILVSADPAENAAIARDAQAIVAAEVAALPKDCSGTPASCPDNEGHGCACSPAAAAPQVVADERPSLHDQIMRLPNTNGPANRDHDHWYKIGHRAARHAAAELAAGHFAAPVQAQEPVLMTKQQVIEAMIDNNLLTDNGRMALLNGDSITANLEFFTQVVNFAAVPALRAPVQPVAVPDGSGRGYSLGRSIIHKCPALVLPQSFIQKLGGTAQIIPLRGMSDEAAKQLVSDCNSAAPAAQGDTTQAAIDVLAERKRQIETEGWKEARDDRYTNCELARAAATYALCLRPEELKICDVNAWPWPAHWWKPTNYRRNLVKSGALILAEIERIDRAAIAAEAAS